MAIRFLIGSVRMAVSRRSSSRVGAMPGRSCSADLSLASFCPPTFPFSPGLPLDRGAVHAGGTYRWNFRSNGFNPGNQAIGFISIVEPLYKDFLSLELTNRWEWNQRDSYTFADQPRAPFRNGVIGMIGPSLIFSPDPLIRLRATYLSRIHTPASGTRFSFYLSILEWT